MSSEELAFRGIDGAEAEEFIRSVNKVARAAGKLRDNDWIIQEVTVAFTGDALRWYIELDDETRNDWLRLQRAILLKYPPPVPQLDSGRMPNLLAIMPVPAAAPAHPRPVAAPPTRSEDCYIRVLYLKGSKTMYVGCSMIGLGCFVPTRVGAVRVRYDRSTGALTLVTSKTGPNLRTTVCLSKERSGYNTLLSNLSFECRVSGEDPWLKSPNIVEEDRWEVDQDFRTLAPASIVGDGILATGTFYSRETFNPTDTVISHTYKSELTLPANCKSIILRLEPVRP